MSEDPKPLAGAYANLQRKVIEYIVGEMEYLPNDAIGDSPIEKVFFAALTAHSRFTEASFRQIARPSEDRPLPQLLQECGPDTLILEPQVQLEGWRVDFLIHAWDFGRVTGRQQWRRLIVECDGHAFHEKTKEQAARDRGRDREFQLRGYAVLRFTGSQIYNEPLECARQISEWMEMGW